MFTVTASVEIRRSPGAVFAFAGDYVYDPYWRKGVVAMQYETEGPPKIGARTRETMRSMGRLAVTVGEVTEFSPSRTAFRSMSGPVPCHGSREFARTPDGTMFTYSLTLKPTGFLGLLGLLLRPLFARQIRADVRRLRMQLEAQA